MKINKNLVISLMLFLVALMFRIKGIFNNDPFWVDEFSSASQAIILIRHGLSALNNPQLYFESNNILTHTLIAFSFMIFGFQEWVARIPFVFIGAAVAALTYINGKKLFNTWIGISSGMLVATSYFMITWSRQARGYMLLISFMLIALMLYLNILKNNDRKTIIFFVLVLLMGMLTHTSFSLLILSIGIHYFLSHAQKMISFVKKPATYVALAGLIMFAYLTGLTHSIQDALRLNLISANNVWYYHSFLWREYSLVTFLGLSGLFITAWKRRDESVYLVFVCIYLLFFNFVFKPYSTRYLTPIFPIFFIFGSYALSLIMKGVTKKEFAVIFPVFFIILNGHKFDVKPNNYYSVNHDFREIALIDYTQMYEIVKIKGNLEAGKTAVVDTWWDRARWYVGYDYKPLYTFRWANEPGLINGITKNTPFNYIGGEKIVPKTDGVRLISELNDLKKAIKRYPKGFLFTDDATMSPEVLAYAKKNLKKEWYADRYSGDDNPLSNWPATLYSWGL